MTFYVDPESDNVFVQGARGRRSAQGLVALALVLAGAIGLIAWRAIEARKKDSQPLLGGRSIHDLAFARDFRGVQSLIASYPAALNSRDAQGRTALRIAVDRHDSPTIGVLLDANADVNLLADDGIGPLHRAASDSSDIFLAELYAWVIRTSGYHYGAAPPRGLPFDPNFACATAAPTGAHHWTPLHYACHGGIHANATTLLELGANPASLDSLGDTPLHLAARHGAKAPPSATATPAFTPPPGITPRVRAHYFGTLISELIGAGADLEAKNNQGRTPLHAAAAFGAVGAGVELIAHNAKLDARDNDGMTPLHVAARHGQQAFAAMLLGKALKSMVNEKTKDGKTPLDLARAGGHLATATAIESFGGKTAAELEARKDAEEPSAP